MHRRHEVADAVGIDGEPEPRFGRDLVALGDGDLAHVVAEAHEPAALPVRPRAGHAHPGADPVLYLRVLQWPTTTLRASRSRVWMIPSLPVAVRGLVEVHEVHVDVGPRQVAVELRVRGAAKACGAGVGRRSTSSTGENVCIQMTRPAQRASALASRHSARISSGRVRIGLKTISSGRRLVALSSATIFCELAATCRAPSP